MDIETVGEEVVSTRLSQVANNMAVHAVSNLNSQDNVTVLIILLCGGPAGYPPAFVNRQPLLKAAPASVEAGGKSTYSYSARTDVKNDREEKVPFSSRGIGSEIDSISSLVEDTTEGKSDCFVQSVQIFASYHLFCCCVSYSIRVDPAHGGVPPDQRPSLV